MIGSVSGESIGTTFMTQTFKSFKAAANLGHKRQKYIIQTREKIED